jgi:hypothetical protein
MRWYVSRNGETTGPHEEAVVRDWAAAGQIGPEAFLRDEAASAWVPLAQTPFGSFRQPAVVVPKQESGGRFLLRLVLISVLAFAGLVAVVVVLGAVSSARRKSEPTGTTESPAPADEVRLYHLLGEYKRNEVSADNEFKGQHVRTTGTVGTISKDILDKPYVTVGTGDRFELPPVVQCMLSDAGKAAQLSPGQKVTVTGTVRGKMMNVLLDDCEIE